MIKVRVRPALLCGVFSFSAIVGSPVSAQQVQPAGEKDRADLDAADIVVTARRVEERLQDVPISITVFNQQQISDRNLVNAQDLANFTPSLSANGNFGNDNSTFAIRGFNQDIGTPPTVGVYFADVVAPRGPAGGIVAGDGAGPGYFFDLENVQVLKGPQGTLFGRNTTGGAVLFVPHKPTDRLEGYLEGSYGNYDMVRAQGMLNIPLGNSARLRLAFDRQKRDGYLINDTGIGVGDYSNVNYIALRASMAVDLTPDLENYTIASYTKSDTNGFLQKLIACNPAAALGAGFACPQLASANSRGAGFYTVQSNGTQAFSKLEQWQIINTTTFKLNDEITLKNIASYAELTQFLRSPLFGTSWSAGIPISFAFINNATNTPYSYALTFTEELQLQGRSADGRLDYQLGGYLERTAPLGIAGSLSQTLLACTNLDALQCSDPLGIGASSQTGFSIPIQVGSVNYSASRANFRNVGLYAQGSYSLTDQLKLTAGFRYTWDRQNNTTTRILYGFPVLPPFTGAPVASCVDVAAAPTCTTSLSAQSEAPTWLIDLDYKPTNDVLIYAKYARGYRAGGIFANAPVQYRVFQPEKVDAYEIGIKTSFGGTLHGTFNIAGFYNNFTNQQIQVGFNPAPNGKVPQTTGVVNAGRSRIYGVEIEATLTPFEGLVLQGGYTYLNATIRAIAPLVSTDPNYVISGQIRPGDPLALSPRHKLTISANYTLPVDKSIGEITLGATFNYSSRQLSNYAYADPATVAAYGTNYGYLNARRLLNLNASWKSVGGLPVDLSVFATNVTGEKYYSFIPGLAGAGFESAILGEPRMYGVRLRYSFGS